MGQKTWEWGPVEASHAVQLCPAIAVKGESGPHLSPKHLDEARLLPLPLSLPAQLDQGHSTMPTHACGLGLLHPAPALRQMNQSQAAQLPTAGLVPAARSSSWRDLAPLLKPIW